MVSPRKVRFLLLVCAVAAQGCNEVSAQLTEEASLRVEESAGNTGSTENDVEEEEVVKAEFFPGGDAKPTEALHKRGCAAIVSEYSFPSMKARSDAFDACLKLDLAATPGSVSVEGFLRSALYQYTGKKAGVILEIPVEVKLLGEVYGLRLFQLFARDAQDFVWRSEARKVEGGLTPMTNDEYVLEMVRDGTPGGPNPWDGFLREAEIDALPFGIVRTARNVGQVDFSRDAIVIERGPSGLPVSVLTEAEFAMRRNKERKDVGYGIPMTAKSGTPYLFLSNDKSIVAQHLPK